MMSTYNSYSPSEQAAFIYKNLPHTVLWKGQGGNSQYNTYIETLEWCTEQFGTRVDIVNQETFATTFNTEGRWFTSFSAFRFKNIDDAFLFKLRWG